jgi:hypothetical protein
MVKSVPVRDHSIVIKPRRRTRAGAVLLLALILIVGVLLAGFGIFSPARLALAQEQMLGLLHGGVAGRDERTFVDACIQLPGADGPQAVTRTVRTIAFGDGTTLAVTFSTSPTPAVASCGS